MVCVYLRKNVQARAANKVARLTCDAQCEGRTDGAGER